MSSEANLSERHTAQLRYRWWERLHFRVFGAWPYSVVERRLEAADRDMTEARVEAAMAAMRRGKP